jgi:hypothetical protein
MFLAIAGLQFEQDFLCSHNTNTHLTNRDVNTGRLWFEAMDAAALSANITLQFCMMDATNALSTTTLRSVTNGRATGDNTRTDAANGADRRLSLHSIILSSVLAPFSDQVNNCQDRLGTSY